jgi:hypothetical protein
MTMTKGEGTKLVNSLKVRGIVLSKVAITCSRTSTKVAFRNQAKECTLEQYLHIVPGPYVQSVWHSEATATRMRRSFGARSVGVGIS